MTLTLITKGELMTREQICSQQSHCLSCPLSVMRTGKDCRTLTLEEIKELKKNESKSFEDGTYNRR